MKKHKDQKLFFSYDIKDGLGQTILQRKNTAVEDGLETVKLFMKHKIGR